jgi:DNA invertase Pin-like site-specific DNA recombinase
MLERQREGIAKVKAQGRSKGRVPTARRPAADIMLLKDAGVRPSEIASRLGIGRASVYRVLGSPTASGKVEALLPAHALSLAPCFTTRGHARIGRP